MSCYLCVSTTKSNCAISYYIGHETVIATHRVPGMAIWREAMFGFLQRNAEQSAAYFSVPPDQVVEVGREIEI